MYPPRPCQLCRFSGVVWGRFGATCGPQKPSRERAAAEPEIRKEIGEESERQVGGKTTGEPKRKKVERTGRKEGEGRGRKPERTEEEAEENVTEPFGGKTQTEAEYYPEEIRVEGGGERTWKRCEERSGETDGNRTQGRGRKRSATKGH